MDIVHEDIDIHGILKIGWWRAYLDSNLSTLLGSKVGSTINMKQIQAYLQEESNSIKNQTIIFKINISEDIKNGGPPTKVQIAFARIDFNQSHYLEPWSLFMLVENRENH